MADKTILDLTHVAAETTMSSVPHHRAGQDEAERCTPQELVRAGANATATANGVPQANVSGLIDAAYLPLATTGSKGAVVLASPGGTDSNSVVQATDGRLSDSRTPIAHIHTASDIASGTVSPARLGSGTRDNTTVLYGDSVYRTPPAAVTLREIDGSPSLTAVTIEVDQAKGLTISDQGSGVGRMTIADAAMGQKGVIELAGNYEVNSAKAMAASDPRGSDPRPPTAHTHPASEIISGVFPIARLATGTPDGTKFVRDDGTLAAPAGGGGSAPTVKEVDGSPSVTAATTIQFNQADGFSVSNPSGSIAQVDFTLPTATTSTPGIVTLAANGGTTTGTAVQASDTRIGHLPGRFFSIREHFVQTTGSGPGWTNIGSIAPIGAVSGHPGIVEITSTHTDSGPAAIWMADADISVSAPPLQAGDVALFGGYVRTVDAAPGAMKFGLSSDVSTFGSDGVYFERAVSGNWHAVCKSGATATSVDSGVGAASGTWYLLSASQSPGSSWEFFIDGASVAVISTHLPSVGLWPEGWVDHETTVDHSIQIDNFYLESVGL